MSYVEEPTVLDYYDALEVAVEQKLIAGDYKLPILPVIATKLIGRLSNDNEDLESIAALVQQDQTLAGHVLRFSNSVLFAGNAPVSSLQEAIARVGFKVIGEFATILTFGNNIFQAKGLEPVMNRILGHAVLSAFIGKEMAILLQKDSDQQFMCGLLHTVGKPIILQLVSEMGVLMPMNPPYDGLIAMTDKLHHKAGTLAGERWKLPDQVRACCAYYRDTEKTDAHQDAVRMTCLASQMADLCQADDADLQHKLKKHPLFNLLGFHENQVQQLFEAKEKIMEDTKAMIGVVDS
ncbi:MAG: HDOD domain-containing protein [Verrucomicrobiota bacterium]|nr:HDOD domain-containing protein [Verrucomicrobiota bacterium]